ncbi:MAG: hypothetical protein AAGU11_04430 [Syntrophobacteraceae bacterium]
MTALVALSILAFIVIFIIFAKTCKMDDQPEEPYYPEQDSIFADCPEDKETPCDQKTE